jgi:uncharacterized membrane protein
MNRRGKRVMIARVRGRPALLLCVALVVAAPACGPDEPSTSCPRDLPMSCPMPAPSFSGQVRAIYQAKCQDCHTPGGMESTKPFTTLAQIKAEPLSTMLGQVYNCVMPKAGAPQLTTDERQALLAWLVCEEPDN